MQTTMRNAATPVDKPASNHAHSVTHVEGSEATISKLERDKTRNDLAELDKEVPATTQKDYTSGKEFVQRSVFEWIHGEATEIRLHQVITTEEVAIEYGIPERHLVRYLRNEIKEAEACMSLPFTLLLVASFSVVAVSHDRASQVRSIEDSLEQDVRENANSAFTGDYIGNKGLEDVNSFADFWSWMRLGLVPLLWHQQPFFHEGFELAHNYSAYLYNVSIEDRGFWLHYNRIIGGLRMVQERDSPEGGEQCSTLSSLLTLYNAPCVGGFDYDLEPEMGIPAERAKHTQNPQREEWLYAFKDVREILDKLTYLEFSSWLDRDTKKIEIAIASYNAEFGIHTLTRINFYFSRGGHIWKLVVPSSQFADWHDTPEKGVYDAIWLLCIAYIFVVELAEIHRLVRVKGMIAIWKEYLNPWNAADWLSVLGGVAIVLVFCASIAMRVDLNDQLVFIGEQDTINYDTNLYKQMVQLYFKQLEQNCNYVRYLRLALAMYPVFIVIRLFKSFAAQPKLALVTETMYRAAPDLVHFFIVFASVFVTFTICGIVLFGREVRSFTTVPRALLSCFRIMLGDIEWDVLSTIGRFETTIWLWTFIIIMTMLMLNMILAIVMDNYEIVKGQTGHAETLLEEAYQWWHRTMGVRRGTYVPLDLVLDGVAAAARRRRMQMNRGSSHRLSRLFSSHSLGGGAKQTESASTIDTEDAEGEAKDEEEDAAEEGESKALESEVFPSKTSFPTSQPSAISTITSAAPTMFESNKLDKDGDIIISVDALIMMVSTFDNKLNLSRKQAIEVIEGAVEDYYARNREGAELDEVMQLIQKVNYRVKKLVKLSHRAHELRDFGPLEELKWFGMEVEEYIKAVQNEREKAEEELKELREEKRQLAERLLKFGPESVFPSEDMHKNEKNHNYPVNHAVEDRMDYYNRLERMHSITPGDADHGHLGALASTHHSPGFGLGGRLGGGHFEDSGDDKAETHI